MSIDEVMDAAHAYSFKYHCFRTLGKKAPMDDWAKVRDSVDALRAAIEQHVAEAVKAEREELLDLVDDYAKDNGDLKAAIRARANNETAPPLPTYDKAKALAWVRGLREQK